MYSLEEPFIENTMYQMEQYGAVNRFPINHIQPFFKINDKTEGGRGRGRGRVGDTDHEDDHGISSSMVSFSQPTLNLVSDGPLNSTKDLSMPLHNWEELIVSVFDPFLK